MPAKSDDDFSCTLTLDIPFPTPRLASTALQAISVDEELSPLVRRALSLRSSAGTQSTATSTHSPSTGSALLNSASNADDRVLHVTYRATTNRMLRVAVNGFFESLGVVVATMRELDIDVAGDDWVGDDFLPPAGLGAEGAADGQQLKNEVDGLGRVQGLTEVGVL